MTDRKDAITIIAKHDGLTEWVKDELKRQTTMLVNARDTIEMQRTAGAAHWLMGIVKDIERVNTGQTRSTLGGTRQSDGSQEA